MRVRWKRIISVVLTVVMLSTLMIQPAQATPGEAEKQKITVSLKANPKGAYVYEYRGTQTTYEYAVDVVITSENNNPIPLVGGQLSLVIDTKYLKYDGAATLYKPDQYSTITLTPPKQAGEDGKLTFALADTSNENTFFTSGEKLFSVYFNTADGAETSASEVSVAGDTRELTYAKEGSSGESHEVSSADVKATVNVVGTAPTLKTVTLAATTAEANGTGVKIGDASSAADGNQTIQASAASVLGTDITGSVTWSVAGTKDGAKGVTIDPSTGVITVDPKATDDTYTVTATPISGKAQGEAKTATLTVTRAAAEAKSIKLYKDGAEISGDTDTAVIPPTPTSGDNTYTYTAKVFDQYDDEMKAATATLSATGTSENAAFADGTLTVKHAADGISDVTLTAASGIVEKSITISFVAMTVNWDGIAAKEAITYGDANSQAFTKLPATGTATVGTTNLTGTFKVLDADTKQAVPADGAKANVTVEFEVTTEGAYKGTKITKSYQVTVNKKPITATVTSVSVEYKADIPTSFDFDVTGLVGQDTKEGLGLTLTTTATNSSDAGSYAVTKSTCTSTNYEVTVAENTALTITPAEIKGVQITPSISNVTILANDASNESIAALKTKLALPDEVTVNFGDGKTEALSATWNTTTAFNKKGAEYTFVGKPTLTGNFKATNYDVSVKITVTPVTGTASITPTEATKAFAAVTADSATWTTLDMPTQVTVTYDNSVTDGSYSITNWTPDLAGLKQQATGTADKSVTMKPTVEYPDWATISNADALAFTMNLTPKYPVAVTLDSVADTIYGTYVTVPEAAQAEIDNGTDENATFKYYYEGVAPTVYAKSETKPTDVGTYKVTAELVSDTHSGKASQEFSITAKALADSNVALTDPDATYTYDKTAKTPAVTVTDAVYDDTAARPLVEGTDYTVAYTNNINAGTATVTVTGQGNYSGTGTADFTIEKASIADLTPTVSGTAAAGQVLTASLEGVDDSEVTYTWTVGDNASAASGKAYVVQPADSNKNITVTATAVANKNYDGTTQPSKAVTVAMVKITGTVTISLTTDTGSDGIINAGDIVTATAVLTGLTQSDVGTLSYYWNGSATEGTATYTVQAEDTEISVVVKPGENFAGELTSQSVAVGKRILSGSVSVTGATSVGSALTATVSADPATANDYTITWLRDGVATGATGVEYTVTADDLGTTITAKVTASGETYTGELVSAGTSIPATAPDAPTVTATAGDAQVTVTWTTPAANGAPITGYTVTASAVTAALQEATVNLPVGTNTYTFTGLTNGTEYTFTVAATNSVGSTSGTAKATPTGYVPDPGTGTDPEEPDYPILPPPSINDGGSTGNSGSGNSGSGNQGGSTTNPDQSVTTTTTDRDGNVTTTTTYPDGSKSVVEMKTDGTIISTDTDAQGNTATVTQNPDGSSVKTVENIDGSSSIQNTTSDGQTSAMVNLPSETVDASNASGAPASLPMDAVTATKDSATAPVVMVNTANDEPVKVEIPVTNANNGTVAVLVKADGTEEIIKTTALTGDGVAVKVNSGDTVKIIDNTKTFSDTATHWGSDAVTFVAARELFSGTSETRFSPDDNMTRGMLMTVLARYENVDTNGGSVWYEKGVAWAVAQGLSDGTNPNGQISREQLATIIYRYAQSKGIDTTAGGSLERFPDAGSVSDWAREAMSWAVGNGIISGVGGVTLDPSGNATRAQVATILMRFSEKFPA